MDGLVHCAFIYSYPQHIHLPHFRLHGLIAISSTETPPEIHLLHTTTIPRPINTNTSTCNINRSHNSSRSAPYTPINIDTTSSPSSTHFRVPFRFRRFLITSLVDTHSISISVSDTHCKSLQLHFTSLLAFRLLLEYGFLASMHA